MLHPVIAVSDMEQALSFYRDLLGMTIMSDAVNDPELMYKLMGYQNADVRAVVLGCADGTEVELAEFRHPRGQTRVTRRFEDAGLFSVTFMVSDLDGVMDRLDRAGTRFTSRKAVGHVLEDGAVVKVVYCFGPDGVLITLLERAISRHSVDLP
jgi:catechol 2,3-dioxygenase-like lactoylglutathione lyase family enzyme